MREIENKFVQIQWGLLQLLFWFVAGLILTLNVNKPPWFTIDARFLSSPWSVVVDVSIYLQPATKLQQQLLCLSDHLVSRQ